MGTDVAEKQIRFVQILRMGCGASGSATERIRGSFRTGPAIALAALATVVALAVVAVTVPVYAVSAEKPLGEMLPATTVFYVAADLHTTGSTRADLDRISSAFTSQPGWSKTSGASEFKHGTKQRSAPGKCFRDTEKRASGLLSMLGGPSALALTGTIRFSASTVGPVLGSFSREVHGVKQALVILAPIHLQRTLFQVLTGWRFSLGLPHTQSTYRGTTIYVERFRACSKASRGAVGRVYAADFKNWILLALAPAALHPVIDTGNGKRPSLDSVPGYRRLMSNLPRNQLGNYYISGTALKRLGLTRAFGAAPGVPGVSVRAYAGKQKPSAGALAVDGQGFSLTALTLHVGAKSARSAGVLAASLPANVEALLSAQGLKQAIGKTLAELSPAGPYDVRRAQSYVHDITADMSGETDLVMLNPRAGLDPRNPSSIPLSLLWQVRNERHAHVALNHLSHLAPRDERSTGRTSDGTVYHRVSTLGYTVRQGWAIVSLNIPQVIKVLAHRPQSTLAKSSSYQPSVPNNARASSVWYLDLHDIRRSIESAFHSKANHAEWTTYVGRYRLMVAPLKSISGSAGTEDGLGYARVELTIARPS